jgi:hypothetical protein
VVNVANNEDEGGDFSLDDDEVELGSLWQLIRAHLEDDEEGNVEDYDIKGHAKLDQLAELLRLRVAESAATLQRLRSPASKLPASKLSSSDEGKGADEDDTSCCHKDAFFAALDEVGVRSFLSPTECELLHHAFSAATPTGAAAIMRRSSGLGHRPGTSPTLGHALSRSSLLSTSKSSSSLSSYLIGPYVRALSFVNWLFADATPLGCRNAGYYSQIHTPPYSADGQASPTSPGLANRYSHDAKEGPDECSEWQWHAEKSSPVGKRSSHAIETEQHWSRDTEPESRATTATATAIATAIATTSSSAHPQLSHLDHFSQLGRVDPSSSRSRTVAAWGDSASTNTSISSTPTSTSKPSTERSLSTTQSRTTRTADSPQGGKHLHMTDIEDDNDLFELSDDEEDA